MYGAPWQEGRFVPDLEKLATLVSDVATGPGTWRSQTEGALGLALDRYAAYELRRAGYEPDAVWPRTEDPRVLPQEYVKALARLSSRDRSSEAIRHLTAAIGQSRSNVQGAFFPKQIDVLVADWATGPELMISTKSMTGSFGKNLNNRWEEFVGDVRNMRAQFPMAALGVLYLIDKSVTSDGEAFQFSRLKDMLLKLQMTTLDGHAYDAAGLIIAKAIDKERAVLRQELVPDALGLDVFFERMLKAVFTRLPVSERVAARNSYQDSVSGRAVLSPLPQSGIPVGEGTSSAATEPSAS